MRRILFLAIFLLGSTAFLIAQEEMVTIYDAMGHLVLQQPYGKALDVSGLTPGIYTVKVSARSVKVMLK